MIITPNNSFTAYPKISAAITGTRIFSFAIMRKWISWIITAIVYINHRLSFKMLLSFTSILKKIQSSNIFKSTLKFFSLSTPLLRYACSFFNGHIPIDNLILKQNFLYNISHSPFRLVPFLLIFSVFFSFCIQYFTLLTDYPSVSANKEFVISGCSFIKFIRIISSSDKWFIGLIGRNGLIDCSVHTDQNNTYNT